MNATTGHTTPPAQTGAEADQTATRTRDRSGPAMARIMALSIRRPWAQLIATGLKHVENRGWQTNYRGHVVIHAGQTWEQDAVDFAEAFGQPVPAKDQCTTGFIAVADLVDIHDGRTCDPAQCAPWGMPDQEHWTLINVHEFAEPIPGRGKLGLFLPPAEVVDAARELLTGAS